MRKKLTTWQKGALIGAFSWSLGYVSYNIINRQELLLNLVIFRIIVGAFAGSLIVFSVQRWRNNVIKGAVIGFIVGLATVLSRLFLYFSLQTKVNFKVFLVFILILTLLGSLIGLILHLIKNK